MKSVSTTWEWSPRTEANRLLHACCQIATGFFAANNFIVLPADSRQTGDNIVKLPRLPYSHIPHFWDRVKKVDVSTLPITAPESLTVEAEKLLSDSNLSQPDFANSKSVCEKHQKEILDVIYQLMPEKIDTISAITIWPTNFGTGCSFNVIKKSPSPVYIWLRQDKGLAAIVEAILTSLTRIDIYQKLSGLWTESEMVVDWLMVFSPLANILKQIDPSIMSTLTLKHTRANQLAKLSGISNEFLKEIGAPTADHVFSLENGQPRINNQRVVELTERESAILKFLIERSPHPVTFDELGDIICSREEDFSLYAIAKVIQRLRDKLELNGISGSFIQTLRGQGYVLKGTYQTTVT